MQCIALVSRSDRGYVIGFPDFPGLSRVGRTFYDALDLGRRALSEHIAALQKQNRQVPLPRTVYEIFDDPSLVEWRRHAVLAQVDLSGRQRRRPMPVG